VVFWHLALLPFSGCFLFAAVAELLDNAVDEVSFILFFGFPVVLGLCNPSNVAN
jgi:hypothetical protein